MMKNNGYKILLRLWITLTSIIAFVASWIVLGHTGKPVSASAIGADTSAQNVQQLAPLPTLAPLPSFDSGSSQIQPLPQQQFTQPNFSFTPRFRTRGS